MLNPDQTQTSEKGGRSLEIKINEERSWNSFANDQVQTYETRGFSFATVSCESFHNGIHLLIGTGQKPNMESLLPEELQSSSTGHMGSPYFAAVSAHLIASICN